jgi:hypothetical protein
MTIYKGQSPQIVILIIFFQEKKKNIFKERKQALLCLYAPVLHIFIKSLTNYVHNFSGNTHEHSKVYLEFYHNIVYIANEGHQIKLKIG